MKKLTRLWSAIALVGIIAVAGAACVSSGDLDSIRSDLAAVQQTVESVSSDVEAIGRRLGALEGTGGVTAPDPDPDPGLIVTNDIIHGTFDLSDAINENIRDGVTLFGINQQQPLQGYLSILNLALLQRVGVTPPSKVINTGPALVTADIIDTSPTRFVNEELRDNPGQLNYVAVQHGRCDWDTFWCTVEAGIELAAADAGVNVQILAPDSFDVNAEAQLLDQAIANNPDGIMVTFPNDQMRASIQRAIDAGIPVIVYNAGTGPINDDLGYLTYLGQDEYQGGYQGGQRLVAEAGSGSHKGICINQNVGQTSLRDRCQGFLDALEEAGIPVAATEQTQAGVLGITNNASEAQQTIADFYAANPDVDIFLTLGPNGASPFYQFIEDEAIDDADFVHGTFDFSTEIAENIRSGRTLFGIDQQPFLQGYGGLTWLYLISLYRVVPPDAVTATGPGFITTDNIDAIPADADGYRSAWEESLDIAVVHHGESGNQWWDTMNQTIRLAASNIGVEVNILVPTTFDLNQVRDLITQAVATDPNGLAVTVTNPVLFKPPIDAALAAGIPVVGFNAGDGPEADGIDYLSYIGQREEVGGRNGGEFIARVAPSGSKAVCINHEVGGINLDARCRGFAEAMTAAGIALFGTNGVLEINNDKVASTQIISDFFAANPDVNIAFTLGPDGADPFYNYLDQR